jgi:hypothetical protein
MGKKHGRLSDEIRRAVDSSGLSRYRICQTLGLAESTMSRFMAGGGMETAHLDALAALLDLHLAASKRPKRKG